MKKILFFIFLGAVPIYSLPSKCEVNELWKNYKRKFEKSYHGKEEQERKRHFVKHVVSIINHNKLATAGFPHYHAGLNEHTDMSVDDHHKQMKGLLLPKNYLKYMYNASKWNALKGVDIPAHLDWREHGLVLPVKNQRSCGSCWAFSSVAALEGQNKKKTGHLVALSEQNLVDCAKNNQGCNGGFPAAALEHIKTNDGINTEKSYPYEATDNECRFKKSSIGATCKGRMELPKGDEEALKEAVATIGPISVAIDASSEKFRHYKHGVFHLSTCSSDKLDHAVVVVGYGTENGKDYWIVRNSWGTSWGRKGYIKMSRNKNNECGIATMACYPLV